MSVNNHIETFEDLRQGVLKELQQNQYVEAWNSNQLGCPISHTNFFEGIFEDRFIKKKVDGYRIEEWLNFYHLVKITPDKVSKSYTVSNLDELNKVADSFTHITYNPFSTRKSRQSEYLNGLYNIVLDFDFNKNGFSIKLNPDELAQHIHNKTGMYPHAIWGTKTVHNYQAIFKIEGRAAVSKAIRSHNRIARTLVALTGADMNACAPSGLHRIPRGVIYQYRDFDMPYKINEFIEDLIEDPIDIEIKNNVDKVNRAYDAITRNVKVVDGKVLNLAEIDMRKHPAIEKLLNAEIFDGYRNNSCFTLALLFYAWGYSEEVASEYIHNVWLEKLKHRNMLDGFTIKETNLAIGNAYSGRYNGASSEWISTVTGVDFHYQIRHTTFFNSRRVTLEDRKNKPFEMSTEIVVDWLKANVGSVIKPAEIAAKTGLHTKTISRVLIALEKKGYLTRKVVNGHARFGYTFELQVVDKKENNDIVIENTERTDAVEFQTFHNKKAEIVSNEFKKAVKEFQEKEQQAIAKLKGG